MKTLTITANSAIDLDIEISAKMSEFQKNQKKNNTQIAIVNIAFSTHVMNNEAVYCSQICYLEQSIWAINHPIDPRIGQA